MTRTAWFLGLLWVLSGALGQGNPPGLFNTDEMRMVMSFNLRYDSEGDEGERAWEARREVVLELLEEYRPLLIGTQEGLKHQLDDVRNNLPGYRYVGVSRQGNTEDEYSAIFFDARRAELVRSGNFWLSETPGEPGSMSWGSGHPRIATWGEFRVKDDSGTVYLFNTHLAFEEGITERQAAVLLQQLGRIAGEEAEVLLTGDFNVPRMTHVWKMFIDAGFRDAWQLAEHQAGPAFTAHGWEGAEADRGDAKIDWVLYRSPRGSQVREPLLAEVVAYSQQGIYPSDHFPVVLTTLGAPKLEADAPQVTPSSVQANVPVTASAQVRNRGARGVAEVKLYTDREQADSTWVVLDQGERQRVSFETRLYEPGAHEVSVELLPAEVVHVEAVPATLSLGELVGEPYVIPGQTVPVTATVQNTGSFAGTLTVNLFVGNQLADSTSVAVPSGESREVGFTHSFSAPGDYTLSIGNQTMNVAVMRAIEGAWRFRHGDDLTWQQPSLDDQGWERVSLPATWEQHSGYEADRVFGWYRKTVTIPAVWEGRPVRVLVGRIDDADKTYFNGELIGQTGRFPGEQGGFLGEWNTVREYVVPPNLIHYGRENTLAVRVYDDLGGGGLHGGPLGLVPLDEAQAESAQGE